VVYGKGVKGNIALATRADAHAASFAGLDNRRSLLGSRQSSQRSRCAGARA
jgi:hypothetical protein